MAKAKPKNPGTVPICINVPVKLMRRLNGELSKLRAKEEYAYISRSAFLSHVFSEWLMVLRDPGYEFAVGQEVRRRLRPERRTTPNGMSKLSVAKVRAIRKDRRPFRVIAADLGVSPSTVLRAKSGATWGWVT